MHSALDVMGGATEIPRRLIQVLIEYYERYTDPHTRTPIFAGGSYFGGGADAEEPSQQQQALDIVDSFAMSVTLSLATIGFLRVYRNTTRRLDVQKQLERLEEMA